MPSFLRFAVPVLLLLGLLVAAPGAKEAQAATVTITADYANPVGTFDHARFLNANEGGYRTHNALTWLPESYPTFKQGGMRMVAITHLLNENFYTVVRGTPPNLTFDFDRLDRVILPLLAQNITPLMGVAFTPQALGGGDQSTGVNNAPPNDLALWNKAVHAMVKHYKDKGHTGWYWEVWNEPDLGPFWGGTQAQYNAMYAATADAVKKADDTAQVGGPTTTQGGWAFFDGFTTFLKANPTVPLDFATFHSYGPDPTFGLVNEAKSRLDAAGRTNVPIFITEWNITHIINGGAGSASDTNLAASYAVRRIADALGRPAVSKVFWFAPKEGLQPPLTFSGDLGLLTVDGHKKAAFNAFELMNKLHPTLLQSTPTGAGAVGAIATKDQASSKVAVLAWNDQAAETDLALALRNLPYGNGRNVRVTRYVVDRTHGNHFQDHLDGVRGWKVGPYENADPVDSRIVAGSTTFNQTVRAAAHSLALFVLEPTTAAPTDTQQLGPTPIPVGSRNLTHGQPVSVSSQVAFGWSPGALVDGRTHTFRRVDLGPDTNGWSSVGHATATPPAEWVSVDFDVPVSFHRIKLFPRDDKECEGYGFPVDFKIQGGNDGLNWTTLREFTNYNNGQPLAAPIGVRQFDISGTYRYVRVYATKLQLACAGDTMHHFQLAELQVESDTNVAAGATPTGSSTIENWGWSSAYVNDGVVSSSGAAHGWSSVGTTTNQAQSITLSLPSVTKVSRVDLFPRDEPGNEGAGFPKTFRVRISTDATCGSSPTTATWTQVASRANYPNPGKFARTIGFPASNARCVQVEATDLFRFSDGLHMFQLAELKLYH
jgi:beta-xylosidase